MKKSKKQLIILLVVLVVIIAAVVAVFAGMKAKENKDQQQADAEIIRVGALTDLAAMEFSGPEGAYAVSFDPAEERWCADGDSDFAVDMDVMTAMEEKLVGLTAYHRFEMESDAAVYGLDKPTATLTAADSAGNTLTLTFGNLNSGKYYAFADGDETTVWTIASSAFDAWNKSLLDLLDLNVLPQPEEKDILSFTVTTGDVSARFDQDTSGEEALWTRTENGETTPADTESAYFKNSKYYISSQYFTGVVAYKYTGDGAEYGLDEPFLTLDISCLQEGEKKEATLYVGDITELDKERRYCVLEGDSNVYIISATFVDYYAALATGIMPGEEEAVTDVPELVYPPAGI